MSSLITVVETQTYLTRASKLLSLAEQAEVVSSIAANPLQGVLMKGLGGIRKMRIGLEGRGKRGGGRVVYWFHSTEFPAVLLWVFAKNDAADLTAEQRKVLQSVASGLKMDFGGSP